MRAFDLPGADRPSFLLALLRKDRSYGDDAARKGMIQVFELLDGSGELVSRYRARLTSALF